MIEPEDLEKKLASLREEREALVAAFERQRKHAAVASFLGMVLCLFGIVLAFSPARSETVKLIAVAASMAAFFLTLQWNRQIMDERRQRLREALKNQNEELFVTIRKDAANTVDTVTIGGRR
jgi:hypothetical protein